MEIYKLYQTDQLQKKIKMCLLSFYFIVDYLLTFIGIKNNIIEEGNYLMVWLFNIGFYQGIIIRFVMLFLILLLVDYIRKRYKYYEYFIIGINSIYSIVMILHIYWIIYYLSLIRR